MTGPDRNCTVWTAFGLSASFFVRRERETALDIGPAFSWGGHVQPRHYIRIRQQDQGE